MFKEFFENNRPFDEIKADKARKAAIKSAVLERISETDTKNRPRLRPLTAVGFAAALLITVSLLIFTVSASFDGDPVKFRFNDTELDGFLVDNIDEYGFRSIKFEGRIPYVPKSYVLIADIAAKDCNVRLIEDDKLIELQERIQIGAGGGDPVFEKYALSDTEFGSYRFFSDRDLDPESPDGNGGISLGGYIASEAHREYMRDRSVNKLINIKQNDDGTAAVKIKLCYYTGDEPNEREIIKRREVRGGN